MGTVPMALVVPDPADLSKWVEWNGVAFEGAGPPVRVLAYNVSPSGWTDELTYLHEAVGHSDHFIDVASRTHALAEISKAIVKTPSTVLEVGTSSGFLLAEIVEKFPGHIIVGSDYTRNTLEAVGRKLPNTPLIQFDLTQCPLQDNLADVIVLLNVLEHIRDHKAAMAHLFRIVKPGGRIVVEVPAGSSLFDVYDRVLMHERRYDMPDLVALAEGAGFAVESRSHLGFLLYPAFVVAKQLNRWRYPVNSKYNEEALVSQMIASTRKSSAAMSWVMRLEQMLQSMLSLPFGIRCLVTCVKPER
jgi:SAM-dependent methyltransferase